MVHRGLRLDVDGCFLMSRNVGKPRPGFFKLRLVRGGPFVPALIIYRPARDPDTGESLDRSFMWEAWTDGRLTREPSPDPWKAGVEKIWIFGREIDEEEFRKMSLAKSEAAPNEAVDLGQLDPLEP